MGKGAEVLLRGELGGRACRGEGEFQASIASEEGASRSTNVKEVLHMHERRHPKKDTTLGLQPHTNKGPPEKTTKWEGHSLASTQQKQIEPLRVPT